ncbi:MAG TPA: hypothetical protein VLU43_01130 [Anaeromyxobacteraceae bacterium]|nr:hypothetical protein [Anaeromyxobacteraceae bacterium]
MELPSNLARAKLSEITWDKSQKVQDVSGGVSLEVQFNPESLKLSYANQRAGNDQRGGAATQHVGEGTTKLAFDLWFDVNAPAPSGVDTDDVRKLTQKVVYFITPKKTDDKKKFQAPGVRFQWGSFLFEGTVESLNETLELFSEQGKPLRAQVSVSLTKQQIVVDLEGAGKNVPGRPGPPPGTFELQPAAQGSTVQSMAAARGIDDWQSIARLNGIEQPRLPAVGATLRFG